MAKNQKAATKFSKTPGIIKEQDKALSKPLQKAAKDAKPVSKKFDKNIITPLDGAGKSLSLGDSVNLSTVGLVASTQFERPAIVKSMRSHNLDGVLTWFVVTDREDDDEYASTELLVVKKAEKPKCPIKKGYYVLIKKTEASSAQFKKPQLVTDVRESFSSEEGLLWSVKLKGIVSRYFSDTLVVVDKKTDPASLIVPNESWPWPTAKGLAEAAKLSQTALSDIPDEEPTQAAAELRAIARDESAMQFKNLELLDTFRIDAAGFHTFGLKTGNSTAVVGLTLDENLRAQYTPKMGKERFKQTTPVTLIHRFVPAKTVTSE